ncbi:MAG TPA: orotate phosphoribosyltransferase [Chlamydiales bacterium]|jgi:uridine monophosphate synthetase|nr:orotate phosphoribosyltransferase [Chlamydiales bacterium]
MHVESIILQLFEMGAIRFGEFTLKSGLISPIYIDLRITISNPKLLVAIAETLYDAVRARRFDLLCGVPYTALPFATAISIQHNIPLVLRRKEKKDYGTAKQIEGIFSPGQRCLLVEDVITSGQSILETVDSLAAVGLSVSDAVVLVDREQGGRKILSQKGIELHSICGISSIVHFLMREKKIDEPMADTVLKFIHSHPISG